MGTEGEVDRTEVRGQ